MTPKRRAPKAAHATPNFDQASKPRFLPALGKTIAVPAALFLSLLWFGQPALRMQWWGHGSYSNPVYERCIYLALTGWKDVRPPGGDCPFVTLMPFNLMELFK
jgi:hypothetical protein